MGTASLATFCVLATGKVVGQDAYQNDSGGPLVCENRGRWTLYGVVNYGEGCGTPHKYGLYARVTKFSE